MLTIEVDENLLQNAARFLGTDDHSAAINAALRALVERETARRLARLGGMDSEIDHVPRRRSPKGPMEL